MYSYWIKSGTAVAAATHENSNNQMQCNAKKKTTNIPTFISNAMASIMAKAIKHIKT